MEEILSKAELSSELIERIAEAVKNGEIVYIKFDVWTVSIEKVKGRGNANKFLFKTW